MARLLIVDDDESVRTLLRMQLAGDGHDCLTAENARQAREHLASGPFDMMLVDVCMPGESGIELARFTRTAHPDTAVIVVSVIGDPQEVQAALAIGISGYIVKPFDKNQILICARNALRQRDLEMACRRHRATLEQAVEDRSRRLKDLVEHLSVARSESEETSRQLADQVHMLQVLLDAIPNPIYFTDAQGILAGCNAAFGRRVGHSPQQVIGRRMHELAPILADSLVNTDRMILQAGGEHVCETALAYPDGTTLETLIHRATFCDARGSTAGLVAVLVDITERRRVELRLAAGERYLKAIWSSIPSGIMVVDARTHRIVDANPKAARMIGLPVGQIIGRERSEFPCPRDTDHCPSADSNETPEGAECTLHSANGGLVPVVKAVTSVDADGRDLLIESFFDVSDRKAAEQALRTSQEKIRQIVENVGIGVVVIDPELRILDMNRQMRVWFPAVDIQEMPHCYAVFNDPPREAPCEYCPTIKTLAGGQVQEALTQTPAGQAMRNYRLVSSPIHDAAGKVVAAIEMVEDVTEREQLEHELLQAQKLESIGQLAAGIAHEINTPTQYVGDNTRFLQEAFGDLLGAVSTIEALLVVLRQDPTQAELVRATEARLAQADAGYLAEEVPKAIEQTLEGVDRIMRIVRSMKEFSHPGSVDRAPADINRALDTTITVARNEWKYVADVETDLDPALPAVPCFAGELNQVFLNILINAAHAIGDVVDRSRAEKGTIRISTRRQGPCVEIRFTDTGGGIPPAIQHRIFDPFFTTKQVGKGTGQGLAIARRVVVEKHGGLLTFETTEGGGTTFIIRLPIAVDSTEAAA